MYHPLQPATLTIESKKIQILQRGLLCAILASRRNKSTAKQKRGLDTGHSGSGGGGDMGNVSIASGGGSGIGIAIGLRAVLVSELEVALVLII